MTRPVPIHHVGATVPDIDAAIDWYTRIMGFRLISGPFDLKPDPKGGDQASDVLGPKLKHLRIAHMATGNGVGFELFQPIDPPFEPREHMVEFDIFQKVMRSGPNGLAGWNHGTDGRIDLCKIKRCLLKFYTNHAAADIHAD